MKKIIIFGSNTEATYHPINPVRDYFTSALSGGYEIIFSDNISDISKLSSGEFRCAISYFDLWDKTIPDQVIQQIHSFIKYGGGFLVIHNGISLQSNHRFRDIIGAEFKEHPVYQKINYHVSKKHFITENIDDFSINEEPYIFNFYDFDSFNVIIESTSEDGTSSPSLWIKDTGKGRIAYLAPGHDKKTFENENIQKLIRNAADWCSTNA
ncbi:MAG TPA: ThuA domain-containing protein [Spirochaetota bacterium]|nr:ThuA domain-containing protein [Spirochaetota bacterium]HOR43577.1 ThuA domain-containing protein [Spirochaetota bacterium]HPK55737.1 ThuA domain-containing protein [Spirochaetota bacterium]